MKYRNPATDRIERKSTGIDRMTPDGMRKAKAFAAQCTIKEMSAPRIREHERFATWAHAYLASRYTNAKTKTNAMDALRDLMVYFDACGIRTPRQVDYAVAAGFVPWRTSGKDLKPMSVNTAILHFVYFSILMAESVRRGFCPHNPCKDVELTRKPPKVKLEITEEHQRTIEAELRHEPEWMRDQWLVLMRTGCRVAETNVPLELSLTGR